MRWVNRGFLVLLALNAGNALFGFFLALGVNDDPLSSFVWLLISLYILDWESKRQSLLPPSSH